MPLMVEYCFTWQGGRREEGGEEREGGREEGRGGEGGREGGREGERWSEMEESVKAYRVPVLIARTAIRETRLNIGLAKMGYSNQ